jgi:transposase
MPTTNLAQRLLLPELEFQQWTSGEGTLLLRAKKRSAFEVCPHCAACCYRVYDRRTIRVKDEPIRGESCCLEIEKRRFRCSCGKVFTESVDGIRKKARTTERYRAACVWAAEQFDSLAKVCRRYRCAAGYLYDSLYKRLRRKTKEQRRTVFPAVIGLDEHSFRRNEFGQMDFVTMISVPNRKHHRLIEVAQGKSAHALTTALSDFTASENVRAVVLDMSKAYKSFAKLAFPNAELVADKFHVVRLLSPAVLKYRKQIKAKRADRATRAVLLASVKSLDYDLRKTLGAFLERHPDLKNVWLYYQRILGLYRTRGYKKAARALTKITNDLACETLPELVRFRTTLREWRQEILAYFKTRITNARCEGFNNKAKVLKKRAYGFRSFENYRLRILSACA